MAITTDNEKYSTLTFNNWMVPSVPISADGIGTDDKKQLLHGFPTQTYSGEVTDNIQFITRYRRRGKR